MDFLPFEEDYTPVNLAGSTNHPHRTVSSKDRMDIKNALMEVLHNVQSEAIAIDKTSMQGFSIQLVIDDITTNFPVYSLDNAQKILEVIQEIFLDIPDINNETMNLVGGEIAPDTDSHFNWWEFEENLTFNEKGDSE